MRIKIDVNLANDSDAHNWLDRILHKVEDGWHVWDTTEHTDSSAFNATTWISSRGTKGDDVRELFEESVKHNAWSFHPHTRRVRVTAQPASACELGPEDACRLAEEALCILVENRFSDGEFVRRVIDELDKDLSRLRKREGCPIRIDSVGGIGQMKKEVRHKVKAVPFRPRLVVIVDSDRKGPSDPISRVHQELDKECRKQKLSCWILAKRAAENYLPRILLQEWKNKNKRHEVVEAWDRLNKNQKDFFDMKGGLLGRPTATDTEEELFRGLSSRDRELLSSGFGKDVSECWTIPIPAKTKLKTELLHRSQHDLQHGIALICKEV